jgi:hypothetical protein
MGGKNTFFLFWGVFKFPSKTKAKPKKKSPAYEHTTVAVLLLYWQQQQQRE